MELKAKRVNLVNQEIQVLKVYVVKMVLLVSRVKQEREVLMEIEVYKVYQDLQVPMVLLVDLAPLVVLVFKADLVSPDHVVSEVIQARLVLMEIVDLMAPQAMQAMMASQEEIKNWYANLSKLPEESWIAIVYQQDQHTL